MFGTTQPLPQKIDLKAFAITSAVGALLVAGTIAAAALATSLNGVSTPIAAAPAALTAPAVRDLGARDLAGSATPPWAQAIRDLGSRDIVVAPAYHPGGFGPAVSQAQRGTLGADADERHANSTGSSQGGSPIRHAGPRAQ
jgi:hypothetical protein